MQWGPRGRSALLGDAVAEPPGVAHDLLHRLSGAAHPDVPDHELDGASDGGVGARTPTAEQRLTGRHREIVDDLATDDHERPRRVRGHHQPGQVEPRLEHRVERGQHHGHVLGPAPGHRGVGRDRLDRGHAVRGRDRADDVARTTTGCLDELIDQCTRGCERGQTVGEAERVAELGPVAGIDVLGKVVTHGQPGELERSRVRLNAATGSRTAR